MAATAVNGGHISRALEFYKATGKYFIVGGTTPWTDESSPPSPALTDFKLNGVIGYKKVDNAYMVVEVPTSTTGEGIIVYRNKKWKKITPEVSAKTSEVISTGATVLKVSNVTPAAGLSVGSKIRIHNLYEATITEVLDSQIKVDTAAPATIPANSYIIGGAQVEKAKSVYVECTLNYDTFPIARYRQIGFCTGVTSNLANPDILKAAQYSATQQDEWDYPGILEVLDNRIPAQRDANQSEKLSLIIEF